MTGPSYQQFQGYPNPVGNYFSGLDAGRQRATEDFNTGQTLETQNALLQRSNEAGAGAQSYPDLQAQQMQAKQMLDMYGPILQNAVKNRNYAMRDQIADVLEQSGNPSLVQFSKVARTATQLDEGKYSTSGIIFNSQTDIDATLQKNPQLAKRLEATGATLQVGVDYTTVHKGMPGEPNAYLEDLKRTPGANQKPQTQTVDVKDATQLDDLEAQYADNPEAMTAIDQARQLLDKSPGGVTVSLPSATKIGARAIKAPQEKYRVDSVSTPEGLQAAVADAPPGSC